MAKHDLLTVLGLESLKEILLAGSPPVWKKIESGSDSRALEFVEQLSKGVLAHFLKDENFLKADPVLLGSWARGELSPGSDLDLLFLGPEEVVGQVVRRCQEQGLKIRSRVPEDPNDWGLGVELWDRLSLLDGKALTKKGEALLSAEKEKLLKATRVQKKKWLATLNAERKSRHERFNSIQNLLEPQLKMGLGGLRDLQQARLIGKLFPDLAKAEVHSDRLFDFYRDFFLWVRCLLHFEGQGDLINGALQPQLASALGFADYHEFMRFLQKGLSRVSFYSDWMLEEATSYSKREAPRARPFQKISDLSRALLQDPSVRTQYEVRRSLDRLLPKKSKDQKRAQRGLELRRFFSDRAQDIHWIALFRSRLMDRLLPEMAPLVGHVQHDQYHRFTADAHILQVIREVLRARKSTRHLGGLSAIAKQLKKKDWQLLLWTAIYHDLAKNRPEDHSDLGASWVKRDLKAFGLPATDVREVQWLVQNHLAFSTAALRRDAQDSRVIVELAELGLTRARIQRLLIFTAIDILGTNPGSWNDWKGRLLANLGFKLLSPERKDQVRLLTATQGFSTEDQNRILAIAQDVGIKRMQKDLGSVRNQDSKGFSFYPARKRLWVRYHQKDDSKGTLARVLGLLFQSGVSVLQASVMTLEGIGVYDWFCLESSGRTETLEKRLALFASLEAKAPPHVNWESIEIVENQSAAWSLLFRGLDQRGLLWNAAYRLFEAGLEIKSAQVQTWGEKAEDLFTVKAPASDPAAWLARFREELKTQK